MEFIKSVFGLVFKVLLVLSVIGAVVGAIVYFVVKKDIKEIQEFTARIREEMETEQGV
ncbi:hypothetical protein GCM10007358_16830 [Phocicoccus schoeneichii]|uniref:Uncharacterized protein n=1 Tax=Phocicoccus schoeneichii TaxID=1812261 RepID=A0A6V7RPU8_9BACL|nr:hypothetical protein [Jeotgalicoccus schoeneichii]GGH55456.1 hypothetical protein GCM10007358_16830 [Jeotgalicoccus schoeneichii]CAD2079649.1 hypothetical protein JEOSCH030_01680 [Jeotgalicoccus schoeneichii]